jgi:hypothetical protein
LLFIATPVAAQRPAPDHHPEHEAHHEHGAHVHGTAWLDVAIDGGVVEIALKGTGADLAGLEGAPADAADVAKVEAARRTLGDPAALFAFEPAGGCTPAGAPTVTPPPSALLAPGADADAGHGDWSADYRFECASSPDALALQLFDRFVALGSVQAQILAPAGQTAAELTRDARRIEFRSAD